MHRRRPPANSTSIEPASVCLLAEAAWARLVGTSVGVSTFTGDIVNSGTITGEAGSGINLDTTSGTTTITNNVGGTITGTSVNGPGPMQLDGLGLLLQ